MKNIEIVKEIIGLFNKNGEKIYLIGGSTRDYLLFEDFADIDLTTTATPYKIKEILNITNIDNFAAQFGTIKIIYKNKKIEITTLRKENNYLDLRHPSSIEFIKSKKIDSKRRDFTINAIYFDGKKYFDYHDGITDLNNKIIRTIKEPTRTIKQDPLRIIRAIRFAFTLNFKLDQKLEKSIYKYGYLITNISKEKLNQELKKFPNNTDVIDILKKYNLYAYIKDKILI